MPTLYVRDVPASVYTALKDAAACDHRSLNAQVVHLLDEVLRSRAADDQRRHAASRLAAARTRTPVFAGDADSVALIREDRDR